jgi:putative methylase
MRKRELELKLQAALAKYPSPDPRLEQYLTPPHIASDILSTAFLLGDIGGKEVIDLGCGTGIFALGAHLLGARVTGLDIDPEAIRVARSICPFIEYICSDIRDFHPDRGWDTAIQNPPFGSQKRKADRPFIEKSSQIAHTLYTMHLAKSSDFIIRLIKSLGGRITHEKGYKFPIPYTFKYHRRGVEIVDVKMFRVIWDG